MKKENAQKLPSLLNQLSESISETDFQTKPEQPWLIFRVIFNLLLLLVFSRKTEGLLGTK